MLLALSLLIKSGVISLFIYYTVRYLSPKNESNNWISAIILSVCLSFFVGFLSLFVPGPSLLLLPIIVYALFANVYKLSPVYSAFISLIIWVILVVLPF